MRCKFRLVDSVEYRPGDGDRRVEFRFAAVNRADRGKNPDEDSVFGKYTPSGEIKVAIKNVEVIERLEKQYGKAFYVDFSLVDE